MSSKISNKSPYLITDRVQLELLTSPVRQEIVDAVQASGPSSIREIAVEIGRPADALYYHVEQLLEGGLLVEKGVQNTRRRDAAVYDVPGRLRLQYDASDEQNVQSVNRIMAAMLRIADRDFRAGFGPDLAVTEGKHRNIWAARTKAWLTKKQLAEVNAILEHLLEIFRESAWSEDGGLFALTWVLSPMIAQPPQRSGSG